MSDAHAVSTQRRVARPGTVGALVSEVSSMLTASPPYEREAEARDLVAAVLDQPRLWPAANRDATVDEATRVRVLNAAARRMAGAPFAYAVGRAAFRHLTLVVDERVLIPRQETEILVDHVLAEAPVGGTVVDIGTGSGAIALALAHEGRFERVIATDVSRGALEVARRNHERLSSMLRLPVEFRHGAWLAPIAGERVRVVVSNPPYIAPNEAASLPASVRNWEPSVALFSGHDGMTATARIIRDAASMLEPGGLLALELDSRRASLAAELALADGRYREVRVRLDLAGRERVLLARRME